MVQVITKNRFSKPVDNVPRATVAYVVYEVGGSICATTRHDVREGKLAVGRLVSTKALLEDLEDRGRSKDLEILPQNVLVSDRRVLAWYTKSQIKPMWFDMHGIKRGLTVEWPSLLWLANGEKRSLAVYGLGSNKRPDARTKVYHAPLMNIGSHGTLCEGTARLPRTIEIETIGKIESCVFDSFFTHVNHKKTIKGCESSEAHFRFWRERDRSKGGIRVKDMVSVGTLFDVLKKGRQR